MDDETKGTFDDPQAPKTAQDVVVKILEDYGDNLSEVMILYRTKDESTGFLTNVETTVGQLGILAYIDKLITFNHFGNNSSSND